MAVLVEAISVIVRLDAINAKYHGGWESFVRAVPNATLCYDSELARVGLMTPQEVEVFIEQLEQRGLKYLVNNRAQDVGVADQLQGLTTDCSWLVFAKLPYGKSGGNVSACWFFDEPRVARGVHFRDKSIDLATPPGWKYEESLSELFGFVHLDGIDSRLKFLFKEDGMDVFLDQQTGKKVFVGQIPACQLH